MSGRTRDVPWLVLMSRPLLNAVQHKRRVTKAICCSIFALLAGAAGFARIVARWNGSNRQLLRYVEDGQYQMAVGAIRSGADANTTADIVGTSHRTLSDDVRMALGVESKQHRYSRDSVLQLAVHPIGGELRFRYHSQLAELVECLLEHGARPDLKDGDGLTPLWYAVACRRTDIAALLLAKGANPNGCDDTKRYGPPVCKADAACAMLLIRYGADVNLCDLAGSAAIHASDAPCTTVLIQHGARLDVRDKSGQTPLMIAVNNRWSAKVKILVASGAKVSVKDMHGATALHYAAGYGTRQDIDLLIKAGAKLDVLDDGGGTPLMWAATLGNTESARALISFGALSGCRNSSGKAAIDLAIEHGCDAIAQLLRPSGIRPSGPW